MAVMQYIGYVKVRYYIARRRKRNFLYDILDFYILCCRMKSYKATNKTNEH